LDMKYIAPLLRYAIRIVTQVRVNGSSSGIYPTFCVTYNQLCE
jgi:hypothetical protein